MPFVTARGLFKVRWLPDGRRVELLSSLAFRSKRDLYIVPPGLVTDLASVPGLLRSFAPPWTLSARPGVLHDWAYRRGASPATSPMREISRREADGLLYEALRSEGVSRLRAFAMWAAVRVAGWRAWRRKGL